MRHLYNTICTTNNERNIAIFAEMAAGGMGFDVITDTNEHIGNYYVLIPLTTSRVLSAGYYRSTEVGGYSGGNLSAVDLPAGIPIAGDFTSVELVSGNMLAYFMY
jgi:hypothetical protein